MIEFFFDCSSPWTYIAFRNVQTLARELNVHVVYRPVLVGGIFNSVNKSVYAAREDINSARNRYMLKDVQDNARQADLAITFPPKVFPVNSVKAMRGCLWIAQNEQLKDRLTEFVEAVFSAYFTDDQDISQDHVLIELCSKTGLDANGFMAGISQPDIKDTLKANTEEAIKRGAFGSPTFFVGQDMYFGNDRLPLVRAALLRAQSAS